MNRREFLKWMGILSGTAAGACKFNPRPGELISFVVPPEEEIIPGEPVYYPSTCMECPAGCGMLVKVRNGHPVKLEGLPGHPVNSGGGLCLRGQASLTRLYHPERIRGPLRKKSGGTFEPVTWDAALATIREALGKSRIERRPNLFLGSRTTGTLSSLIDEFCRHWETERLPEFEIYSHGALRKGYELLFGRREIPAYRADRGVDLLVTFGADLFETFLSPVAFSHLFSRARQDRGLRLFHLEPHLSLTGVAADVHLPINPRSEHFLLTLLLQSLPQKRPIPEAILHCLPDLSLDVVSRKTGLPPERIRELADTAAGAPVSLFLAGGVSTAHSMGLLTAVLAGLLQWSRGAVDCGVDFSTAENFDRVGTMDDFALLRERLSESKAGVMILSHVDPVSAFPAFRNALGHADFRVAFSEFMNPTAETCDMVLPLSHVLESWGDAAPRKNMTTVIQPVLEPLHDTRTAGDILLSLMGNGSTYQRDLFSRWQDAGEELIERGFSESSPEKPDLALNLPKLLPFLKKTAFAEPVSRPSLVITPSLRAFDGRSRILPLLNEIPDPLTTISYGDWLSMSDADGREANLEDGSEVEVTTRHGKLTLPVKVQSGLQQGIFALHRPMAGSLALPLDRETGECAAVLEITDWKKTGAHLALPVLAGSMAQEKRKILPSIEGHQEAHHHEKVTLYPGHKHKDYRWSMAVDLDLCTGCSACIAACYVENNIAVAGLKEHLRGREMSWIRLEPFHHGNGRPGFTLMLCQHCDNAPCESVCPVYATYHNEEGLNAQVYNRCVGTRYCSNNCPYKARRFNWFAHTRETPLDRMYNPDVYVRTKGVMEKCTFCIQRIQYARGRAKDEGRKIRDGEVVPACAQACPTGAVVFGNILDRGSRVYRMSRSGRVHRVLEQYGTEPSVYYLRRRGFHEL